MSDYVELIPTWHPAGMMRAKARTARSFLLHCEKSARAARGKRKDPLPKVEINPTRKRATEVLRSWPNAAFDIETKGLSSTEILAISASGARDLVLVWDTRSPNADLRPLKEWFESDARKIVQNGAFDIPILEVNGFKILKEDPETLEPLVWDTVIEQQIRYPDEPANLSYLASISIDVEAWKHTRSGDLLFYNGLDSNYLFRIWDKEDEDDPYVERRMRVLWRLLIPLSQRGIFVDKAKRGKLRRERALKLASWERRAAREFKKHDLELPIGPRGGISFKKAQAALYDVLGLPVQYHDQTGKITTNKKALKKLSKVDQSGLVELLLERSELKDAEVPLSSKESPDGRMRSRFVLGGDEKSYPTEAGKESPASGRFASRQVDPTKKLGANLQNWKEWVRCILRARPGWKLVKADYSQIELRLIARFSRDPKLLEALETDAHLRILYLLDSATGLYNVAERGWEQLLDDYRSGDDFVKTCRNDCKHNLVYGWTYRMGARKMENTKGVPFARAKLALDGLRDTFGGVVRWWAELEKLVQERSLASGWGWLKNDWGRGRYFFTDDNDYLPKVCNFLPQSTAAEVLVEAMLESEDEFEKRDTQMLLTVHDELVFETPEDQVDDTVERVRRIMERPVKELDNMTFPVEISVGTNWAKWTKDNPNGCREV